ncbi:autotransporter outer membrane beta-barrel domain-containing protein [Citrobacter sp. wls718]|nr:autotransporter outer membrane beta-barrel domain-containing protein [Citrobacter sp. wls718]STE16458.1 autotransporter [Escherichia coli]
MCNKYGLVCVTSGLWREKTNPTISRKGDSMARQLKTSCKLIAVMVAAIFSGSAMSVSAEYNYMGDIYLLYTDNGREGVLPVFEAGTNYVVDNLNVNAILTDTGYVSLFSPRGVTVNVNGDVSLGSKVFLDNNSQKDVSALYSQVTLHAYDNELNIINNNKVNIWGRIRSETTYLSSSTLKSSAINIISGDDSYFQGVTDLAYSTGGVRRDVDTRLYTPSAGPLINLTFNGKNSVWDMNGDSELTNLTLNDATLNFMAGRQTEGSVLTNSGRVPTINGGVFQSLTAGSDFKTLIVAGDYHGNNGNIIMNTILGDDDSLTDRMVVHGDTSGSTHVAIRNAGGVGAETLEGIELITVLGNSYGEFKQNGRIVAGAYDYTLHRGIGTKEANWYLSSALTPPSPEPDEPVTEQPEDPITQVPEEPVTEQPEDPAAEQPETPALPEMPEEEEPAFPELPDAEEPAVPVIPQPSVPVPIPREHAVRPEAGLYGMNLAAANTLFHTRLQDRLGETRYTDIVTGEEYVTSMWQRNIGGHTRQHDSSGQLDIQANRYVMQVGGDIVQWGAANTDRFHFGVMAGYANQKSNAVNQRNRNKASSSISGYNVGLYGTWLQNSHSQEGAYVDSWLQYSWFDNTVSGVGVAAERYKSKGFTTSVESGYSWKLKDLSKRNALYVQPKAQITWMGVKADSFKETNGTRVEGEGQGNIQTRLGARLYGHGHSKQDEGKGRSFQPFVEVNWVHNTTDFGTLLNGERVSLAGSRNIGEIKTGVEGQLTTNITMWGNVGQQLGDQGYSDSSVMLGVKATF